MLLKTPLFYISANVPLIKGTNKEGSFIPKVLKFA